MVICEGIAAYYILIICYHESVSKKQIFEQIILWAGILAAGVVAWWVARHFGITEDWVKNAGAWGPVVAVGLYILLCFTPIPSDGITVLCGVLYGWGYGVLISWIGNTLAAMVEYFVFRDVRTVTQFDAQKKKLPKWLQKWPVNSFWFLFGVRFIPGFGGKLVSIMAGMYKVAWWRFLWTAAVANVLGSFVYILFGWGLVSFFHF